MTDTKQIKAITKDTYQPDKTNSFWTMMEQEYKKSDEASKRVNRYLYHRMLSYMTGDK